MSHKLKKLPNTPTQEEKEKHQPLVKLRRALQAFAKGNLYVLLFCTYARLTISRTRSTSSPSSSPKVFASHLSLSIEYSSPAKRRSFIDVERLFVSE